MNNTNSKIITKILEYFKKKKIKYVVNNLRISKSNKK